jgi:hypothetical protein
MSDGRQSVSWAALGSLAFWLLAFVCSIFFAAFSEVYVRDHPGWNVAAVVLPYTILSVVLSAALYELRRLLRTFYGLIEFAIMLCVSAAGYIAIIRHGGNTSALPPVLVWIESLQPSLTFMASIYLGVRALDNIGEGLRPGSGARAFWDIIFPNK